MSVWWQSVFLGAACVAAAAVASGSLILLLRPFLSRYAVAQPNARSSHRAPTPQGGGIAVVTATLAVSMVAAAIAGPPAATAFAGYWPIALTTAFIAVVGVSADANAIGAVPRLLLQAAAVVAVVTMLPPEARVVPALPFWIERVALGAAVLWFINLVNFMDGIDWMTVAEVVPVSAGLALSGALGALPPLPTLVALALWGAIIGFAPFNRPVARLFLGDVGSLPIGLLLGWLLMLLAASGHFAAAILLPLYYLADATSTLTTRLVRGRAVWRAHREHFYQRAVDRGVPVGSVVGWVFAVNIALATLALLTVWRDEAATDIAAVVAGCALVVALLISLKGIRRQH